MNMYHVVVAWLNGQDGIKHWSFSNVSHSKKIVRWFVGIFCNDMHVGRLMIVSDGCHWCECVMDMFV
jgi:hypothetical protein